MCARHQRSSQRCVHTLCCFISLALATGVLWCCGAVVQFFITSDNPMHAPPISRMTSCCHTLPRHLISTHSAKLCMLAPQAVLAGLQALRVLGVWGVALDLSWSQVEQEPRQYSWAAYRPMLALVREAGLKLQVNFCFHADQRNSLPAWVLEIGEQLPDIFFTDKAGVRSGECLSLGMDDGERMLRGVVWKAEERWFAGQTLP